MHPHQKVLGIYKWTIGSQRSGVIMDHAACAFAADLETYLRQHMLHLDTNFHSVFYLLCGFVTNIFSSHRSVTELGLRGGYIALQNDYITLFTVQAKDTVAKKYKIRVFNFCFAPKCNTYTPLGFENIFEWISRDFGAKISSHDLEEALWNTRYFHIKKDLLVPHSEYNIDFWVQKFETCHSNNFFPFHPISSNGQELTNSQQRQQLLPTFQPRDFSPRPGGLMPKFFDMQLQFVTNSKIYKTNMALNACNVNRIFQGATIVFEKQFQLNVHAGLNLRRVSDRLAVVCRHRNIVDTTPSVFMTTELDFPKETLIGFTASYNLPESFPTNANKLDIFVIKLEKLFDPIKNQHQVSIDAETTEKTCVSSTLAVDVGLMHMCDHPRLKLLMLQNVADQFHMSTDFVDAKPYLLHLIGQMVMHNEGFESINYFYFKPQPEVHPKINMDTLVVAFDNSRSIVINLIDSITNDELNMGELALPENLHLLGIEELNWVVNVRKSNINFISHTLGTWESFTMNHFSGSTNKFSIDIYQQAFDMTYFWCQGFSSRPGQYTTLPKFSQTFLYSPLALGRRNAEWLQRACVLVEQKREILALYSGIFSERYFVQKIMIGEHEVLHVIKKNRELCLLPRITDDPIDSTAGEATIREMVAEFFAKQHKHMILFIANFFKSKPLQEIQCVV